MTLVLSQSCAKLQCEGACQWNSSNPGRASHADSDRADRPSAVGRWARVSGRLETRGRSPDPRSPICQARGRFPVPAPDGNRGRGCIPSPVPIGDSAPWNQPLACLRTAAAEGGGGGFYKKKNRKHSTKSNTP